jgi:hypothetical protein
MRPSMTVPLVVLALLVAGCSVAETASPPPGASASASSPSASPEPVTSIGDRRPLPSGFPVLPGAVPVPMPPDDLGLIGLWESDRVGSAAYDFYVAALPEAGYPIVGLYPGGEVALIRFSVPGGEIWQVLAHGAADGGVAIEVRLDRP